MVTKNAKLRLTDDNGMTVQSASVFSITHNSGIAPEADQLGFECFPNPAHDNVLVNFSNKLNQASELNIYDLKGIRVAQTMLSTGANQASVDLKAITPGVYFVEVKNNQFVAKQKLVIY